jgi:hypothetical protein
MRGGAYARPHPGMNRQVRDEATVDLPSVVAIEADAWIPGKSGVLGVLHYRK